MKSLGLELGDGLVRAVVADVRHRGLQVLEAATIPCDEEIGGAALQDFLSTRARRVGLVVVGLPLARCSVKLVALPPASDENLARLARVEAETQLPVPLDQVEFSHAVVDSGGEGRSASVVLAACRREVVARALEPLAAAGTKAQVVDVSALALANVFAAEAQRRGQPLAVVNVGSGDAEMVILDGSGRLGAVHGLSEDDELLADEIRRAFQAYAGVHGTAVDRLVLVGERAAELQEVLADALLTTVELGDPWSNSRGQTGLGGHAATYAVATGLAMRAGDVAVRVNLRPQATVRAQRQRRQTSAVAAVVALVFILMLGAAAWFGLAWQARSAALAAAQAEVARLRAEIAASGSEDPAYLDLLRSTAAQVRADSNWLEVLRDLSASLPGGLSIDELTCDRERTLTIRGQAVSNAVIAQAIEGLGELGRFEQVQLDYADAERVENELVFKFQLTCRWPGPAKGGA